MAENLFPEDDILDEETEEEETEAETSSYFPEGYKFDADLLLDGKGNIVGCTAAESWLMWCKRVLETPRYKCDAYSDDIGIDTDEVFAAETRDAAESILKNEISEALTADPYNRTAYVEDVVLDWIAPDSVHISVSVVGYDGTAETIETTITQ